MRRRAVLLGQRDDHLRRGAYSLSLARVLQRDPLFPFPFQTEQPDMNRRFGIIATAFIAVALFAGGAVIYSGSGASKPPALIVVLPTVPLPDSAAPELTMTSDVIEPVTLRIPASTVVGPV